MARKITQSQERKQPREDDLAVLMPDRTLRVGDREVTVREYRFLEGLRVRALAEPIIASIAEMADHAEALSVEQLDGAFGAHPEIITAMIARSCDQDAAWVESLPSDQGEMLFNVWWAVNAGFFVRCVQQRVRLRRASAFAGRASSPPSSRTATTPTGSVNTPNGS